MHPPGPNLVFFLTPFFIPARFFGLVHKILNNREIPVGSLVTTPVGTKLFATTKIEDGNKCIVYKCQVGQIGRQGRVGSDALNTACESAPSVVALKVVRTDDRKLVDGLAREVGKVEAMTGMYFFLCLFILTVLSNRGFRHYWFVRSRTLQFHSLVFISGSLEPLSGAFLLPNQPPLSPCLTKFASSIEMY